MELRQSKKLDEQRVTQGVNVSSGERDVIQSFLRDLRSRVRGQSTKDLVFDLTTEPISRGLYGEAIYAGSFAPSAGNPMPAAIKQTSAADRRTDAEVDVLMRTQHANIVSLLCVEEDSHWRYLAFEMRKSTLAAAVEQGAVDCA